MHKPTRIARTPCEHFMHAVDEEFSKFERKEREFRQADREERAADIYARLLPRAKRRPELDVARQLAQLAVPFGLSYDWA